MTSYPTHARAKKTLGCLAGALIGLALTAGCESVEQDDIMLEQGTSPDPTAVLEGSVLYSGPRPTCKFGPDGKLTHIDGNVVLTLYRYESPPFPEGSALNAINLLVVSGDELFDEADCLAPGTSASPTDRIAKSVPFRWPRLALEADAAAYQVRGFYDYDEDMIPLFVVTRQPTAGDILGGALEDQQDPRKGWHKIELRRIADAPDGQVVSGLTVTLDTPIVTERPAFRLNGDRRLAADAPFEPPVDVGKPGSAAAALRRYRALTCPNGQGDGATCGLKVDLLTRADNPKLAAAGVNLALDDVNRYELYAKPVDAVTVVPGKVDSKVPDYVPDPHPVLGPGFGVGWFTPMVTFTRTPRREDSAIETLAGIPSVTLVGSVLLGEDGQPAQARYREAGAPIAVPPVAVVQLRADRPECRITYFPPGTDELITSRRASHCGELPTGMYTTHVHAGIAPTTSREMPAGGQLPPGTRMTADGLVEVDTYSGQSWSVPNELGDPTQLRADQGFETIPHQGVEGAFVVSDPSDAKVSCTQRTGGLCAENKIQLSEDGPGADFASCLLPACCDHISHLCEVPLCAKRQTPDGPIVGSPTRLVGVGANGRSVPDCVPFEMPRACCPARAARSTPSAR